MQKLMGLQEIAGSKNFSNMKGRFVSKNIVEVLETVLSTLGVTRAPGNANLWVKLLSDFRSKWFIDLIDALIIV